MRNQDHQNVQQSMILVAWRNELNWSSDIALQVCNSRSNTCSHVAAAVMDSFFLRKLPLWVRKFMAFHILLFCEARYGSTCVPRNTQESRLESGHGMSWRFMSEAPRCRDLLHPPHFLQSQTLSGWQEDVIDLYRFIPESCHGTKYGSAVDHTSHKMQMEKLQHVANAP